MNLNYDKIRAKVEHGGNHWTSYSDLFLVLSVVFLLLYVVANLRSGALSIATMSSYRTAMKEAEDLRQQIKTYEGVKDNYLKQGATQDEVQIYQDLMGKLSLLEGAAKDEKNSLLEQAQAADQKQKSLNHYQELVKNIINANMVAQAKLKKRDLTIVERENQIFDKEKNIEDLNHAVANKQQEIARNNQTISGIEANLQNKIAELKYAYRSKKQSKQKLESQIAALQADSEKKIQSLKSVNSNYISQLQTAKADIEEKNRKTEQLMNTLSAKEQQNMQAIQALEAAHKSSQMRDAEYQAKLQGLNSELAQTRNSMKETSNKYQGSIESLKQANETLQKNLRASIAKQNEMRALAGRLKENFRKAGINADIDPNSGDVTINFMNEYFDTGRAMLKPGMRNIINRLIPEYAKSLYADPKIVSRLSSLEIVGFASPTYQGKFVDPSSLNGDDKRAVNYNMDLSYQRAKSIFEYVFDTNRMQFQHQKEMLPLVKVTGRSYLATDKLEGRMPANATQGDYCQKFDCKKSQKVIIRFNLKDK